MGKSQVIIALLVGIVAYHIESGAHQCCGDRYAYAQALYWKPVHCGIQWTADRQFGTGLTVVSPAVYSAAYDWGFRVGADYCSPCWRTGIRYIWSHSRSQDFLAGNLEVLGGGSITFTTARADFFFRYQTVVGELGFQALQICQTRFDLLAQARWTRMDMSYVINGSAVMPVAALRSTFNGKLAGGGLGVAVEGCRTIWCRLTVVAHLEFGAMIGHLERVSVAAPGGSARLTGNPYSHTVVVPEMGLDVGLRWQWKNCRKPIAFGARLGYALDYYLNGLLFPILPVDTTNDLPNNPCQDVGFGGLYFGLDFNY